MDMTEKQLSSEYKFRGRIMTARVDEVSLPNGKTAPREVCEHVGGVGVLPIDKDGNVILVRQFRYAFDLFAALDLTEGEMQPDEDEFVEVVRLPIAEVEKMIERDEIRDAKTVAAMYRAKLKNLY